MDRGAWRATVHGVTESDTTFTHSLRERKVEWLQEFCVCELLSRVCLFATPQTTAHQASLSIEFFRQYGNELPFPSPSSPDTHLQFLTLKPALTSLPLLSQTSEPISSQLQSPSRLASIPLGHTDRSLPCLKTTVSTNFPITTRISKFVHNMATSPITSYTYL